MKIKPLYILIVAGILVMCGVFYLLNSQSFRISKAPFNSNGCDSSATSADCSKIPQPSTSQPIDETQATTSVNTFGPLTNIYEDKADGLSLKYPGSFIETKIADWHTVVDNDTKAQYWIDVCNSRCNRISFKSLNEYRDDFTRKNPNIPISSVLVGKNIQALRLNYSALDKTPTECAILMEKNPDAGEGCGLPNGVKYILFSPKNGFLEITLQIPPSLETEITKTIVY